MVEPRRLRMLPRTLRRRPTKPQIAALVLVTLLSFGPVVAVITVVGRDSGPVAMLAEGREPPADGAHLDVSFTSVSPATGTMTALIQVEPFPALLDEAGLAEELVLRVNDARGDTSIVFPAGEPLRALTVTLPLTGRSIVRYPFDRYRSAVLMRLERSDGGDPVDVTVDVSSQLGEFDVRLDDFDDGLTRAAPAVGVGAELSRATTTTVYAVGIMILMWGLALAGVAILWAITIWGLEVPPWSVGYLVGVLFALAPLRSSLPGSPPPGTLLDFVAFYWCIGLVGLTLIMVLGVWLQRTRPARVPDLPDEADGRP